MERQPLRTELVRCRLMQGGSDEVTLTPVARGGSSLLTTLLEANGIAEIEAGNEPIEAGQAVPFLSWHALGIN
jgi:molybdopterin biosynthesis enzyme